MRTGLLLIALLLPLPAMPANRLAAADSPYLRQHAENPVDWYPWGDEAFEKARAENKPVFVSIGYSTCYWCRVAEETLYRDPRIAAQMNAGFVSVKVDREQRPDLDRLYMTATRLLGSSGGWPNNLFLTPERKPFFAGSYFPPQDDDFGRPGFPTILARISEAWTQRHGELLARAERIAEALRQQQVSPSAVTMEPARWRQDAQRALLARADKRHGGIKGAGAAKFPQVPELLLLGTSATGRSELRRALDAMAYSALRDQLGGGFHRYAIDPRWSKPHFEKMLYDNAQLLKLYATAGSDALHRDAARETAAFLLRELQAPTGGFYAALDATSEGREGAYYIWDEAEVREILGAAAHDFFATYRLVPLSDQIAEDAFAGRAPGTLLLREEVTADRLRLRGRIAALAPARAALLRQRALRSPPPRDEKIILAWNGLAIEALAVAGYRLRDPRLTEAARRAAERLWRDAWEPAAGRLRHTLFEGRPQGEGFLEDYALFGIGLLALDTATGEGIWRQRAVALADAMLARFSRADGSLADSVHEAELFALAPEFGDGPYAAGVSAAYGLFAGLAAAGEKRFLAPAERLLAALAPAVARAPDRWPALLAAVPKFTGRTAGAPAPSNSAAVVSPSARWQAGRLLVALRIAPGWHVNANPASLDYLIPTRISFDGAQPQAVRYPRPSRFRAAFASGQIDVYEGAIAIEASFDGEHPTAATLEVQACSRELCLPPATVPISLR